MVSEKVEFERNLFQGLVLLGQKKELLNVQHRKHPSISLFPKRVFYENQILDGPMSKKEGMKGVSFREICSAPTLSLM